MILLSQNQWINPEQICMVQKEYSRLTGETKLNITLSSGQLVDIQDNENKIEKEIMEYFGVKGAPKKKRVKKEKADAKD